jgi:hypothetical protein
VEGRFQRVVVKEKAYWYFDIKEGSGRKSRRHVGPVEDTEITRRVETQQPQKDDLLARRRDGR